MKSSAPFPILAVIIGILTIICAINDYDWFMKSSKAEFFVKTFGRDGARKFYVILGIFIVICGILAILLG